MRLLWMVLAVAACSERKTTREEPPVAAPIPPPPPMKNIDEIGEPGDTPSSDDWSTTKTCAVQDAELIYVVDAQSHLLSFDPRKLPGNDPFHLIGTLRCTSTSTPNSMAIDRKGVAWIGHQNGKVYRASIIDAKCDKNGWTPIGDTTRVFGMGFVTKGPRTEEELLFVAGGVDDPTYSLATIDTDRKTWNPVGRVSIHAHPELTGTSEGKLYAYFPTPGRGFVQELDRAKGTVIGPVWKLPSNGGMVDSYAFAHYGGVFYVFTSVDGVAGVHAIHKQTGKVELVRNNLDYEVVGAGVSTCAPLLEAPP